MNLKSLKDYIIINEKIEYILNELKCHHIKLHGGKYYTCSFPDGDNKKGMAIYIDTLNVDAYTRNIKDKYGNSDIFSLICFIKKLYFSEALKWTCDILGLDYYKDEQDDIPTSLQITRMILDMSEENSDEINEYLKPINEKILTYYKQICNKLFLKDNINYKTQREFEIGYDLSSHRITIPIRDELGTLVGVKGRDIKKDSYEDKYIYLESCAKSQILYGLYKTLQFIREKNEVIVVESEKSVLVLWEQGIKNVVAIGGHILSKTQVEKITRLGVSEIILCYDEDVNRNDNGIIDRQLYLEEAKKFIPQIKVSAMVDIKGQILNKKESPVDDMSKFNKLYNERKVLQSGTTDIAD